MEMFHCYVSFKGGVSQVDLITIYHSPNFQAVVFVFKTSVNPRSPPQKKKQRFWGVTGHRLCFGRVTNGNAQRMLLTKIGPLNLPHKIYKIAILTYTIGLIFYG